jgi:murein L,D-transpeptidase YcbB/YkuD
MLRYLLIFTLLWSTGSLPLGAQTIQWSTSDAEALLSLVEGIKEEGLDPADYDPAQLRSALASGNVTALNSTATAIFMHLASDLGEGHVRERDRIGWRLQGPSIGGETKQALLVAALSNHQVKRMLLALLPRHREYERLKTALAATPPRDKAAVQRLRANLERWRWMPRDLGRRFILVNVPAFELTLVEDGREVARHKIIVGKPATPTPQFSATVQAVQLNPSWYVPSSIVAESIGKLVRSRPEVARARGYIVSKAGIRQRPGPDNALGEIKLVMPNPFTVYLHDTPTKQLFEEEIRAFSHGCIRTQHALDFARALLADPRWDKAAIDRIVASRSTTDIPLGQPVPIYIGYFTAASDADGEMSSFPDIYGRDGPVVAALVDREPPDPFKAP